MIAQMKTEYCHQKIWNKIIISYYIHNITYLWCCLQYLYGHILKHSFSNTGTWSDWFVDNGICPLWDTDASSDTQESWIRYCLFAINVDSAVIWPLPGSNVHVKGTDVFSFIWINIWTSNGNILWTSTNGDKMIYR